MNKVPYTNETTHFVHIGGVTIPPGETRDVDATLLPGYEPPVLAPPEPEVPPDLLAELLKASIKNIVPEMPGMSADDLARAVTLEEAGQKRRTLLEAFAAENLRRLTEAAAKAGSTEGAAPGDTPAPKEAAPDGTTAAGAAPDGSTPAADANKGEA